MALEILGMLIVVLIPTLIIWQAAEYKLKALLYFPAAVVIMLAIELFIRKILS